MLKLKYWNSTIKNLTTVAYITKLIKWLQQTHGVQLVDIPIGLQGLVQPLLQGLQEQGVPGARAHLGAPHPAAQRRQEHPGPHSYSRYQVGSDGYACLEKMRINLNQEIIVKLKLLINIIGL